MEVSWIDQHCSRTEKRGAMPRSKGATASAVAWRSDMPGTSYFKDAMAIVQSRFFDHHLFIRIASRDLLVKSDESIPGEGSGSESRSECCRVEAC